MPRWRGDRSLSPGIEAGMWRGAGDGAGSAGATQPYRVCDSSVRAVGMAPGADGNRLGHGERRDHSPCGAFLSRPSVVHPPRNCVSPNIRSARQKTNKTPEARQVLALHRCGALDVTARLEPFYEVGDIVPILPLGALTEPARGHQPRGVAGKALGEGRAMRITLHGYRIIAGSLRTSPPG